MSAEPLPAGHAGSLGELVLESALMSIFALHPNSTVRYANPAAISLFGYPLDDLRGRPVHELIHYARPDGTSNPFEGSPVQIALRDRKRCFLESVVFFKRDGTPVPGDCMAAPLLDGDRVVGGLLMIRDLSDRWRDAASYADKMDAVERVAGGVAHDFNNLLTSIATRASMLTRKLADPDLAADAREIVEAASRAAQLTDQLLTFARKRILRIEPVLLDPLIARARPLLEPLLGDDRLLTLELGAPGLVVEADRSQLEQCLINLTVNAREALPRTGELCLRTRPIDIDGRPGVELAVADDGIGMTAEVAARACEPFFTTRSAPGRSGMGLATVRGIATQLGGSIRIDSDVGSGTVVTVQLPAASE